MPARIAGMPKAVCRIPVASPARQPETNATRSARYILTPEVDKTTKTAPPVASEPSTVKSARSSTL